MIFWNIFGFKEILRIFFLLDASILFKYSR